jgi:S-adenosylmethionine-diacylgycerolhomoserine-N-methlytransferase
MSSTPESFPAWIAGLRKWHGWLQLSAERPYMHAEEEYNSHYGVAAVETREGEGFCNLLQAQQVDTTGPALEIGCGTGRNLVLAAGLYPNARFFGIDVSTEMLTSAISAISRRGMTGRIRVAHGDGTAFDPQLLFNLPAFDHVMISYSLSMIPDWRAVLQAAANRLTPGGRLHVVDFGNQERLPGIARALLLRWLAMFDVTPRDDLKAMLTAMAESSGAELKFERPFRGYAQYAVMTSPAERSKP